MKKERTLYLNTQPVYRLVKIEDANNQDKSSSSVLYKERIHCVGRIRRCEVGNRMSIHFIEDPNANPICLYLNSSEVLKKEESGDSLVVTTKNTVYTFVKSERSLPSLLDMPGKVIELYYTEEGNTMAAGFFYSEDMIIELEATEHVGMFVDSLLIHVNREAEGLVPYCDICRYYLSTYSMRFYKTIYQRDSLIEDCTIVIHNTTEQDLSVSFEFGERAWYIQPKETIIIPYASIKREE